MSSTSAASSATSGPSRCEPAPFPPNRQLLFARAAPLDPGRSVFHTWGMEGLIANPDTPLPADMASLQELVRQLLAEVRRLRAGDAQLRQDNEQLRHRLDQALRLHFGQRSERSRPRRARVPRDPAERGAVAPRSGHGRQALPEHLPRERVEYDLAEADKPCPCCGGPRVCIGEQVSEQLDYRPASFFVVQHAKKTYACRSCDGPGERRFTTAGPAVLGPIPKGLPGPGLLAHLLTCKYADHLPLNRQVGIVARSGVRLSRSTLFRSRWENWPMT
jgi:transposase